MSYRFLALFEHGRELHCYASGQLRLLRPLRHPTLQAQVELTASRRFDGQRYDAVIVERLWRPDISLDKAKKLVSDVHAAGCKLIYAQDDNLFDQLAPVPNSGWFDDEHLRIMELFAGEADGVLVSTERLRQRMQRYNANIVVVPNALDERLISARPADRALRRRDRVVIGYMGTRSHDADLELVVPALRRAHARWGAQIEFEIVGAVADQETLRPLRDLPLRELPPPVHERDYPLFFSWFSRTVQWDIGLAPLCDTVFNACKSDIKLLDYSAIGCAGIYSRLAPYEDIAAAGRGLVVPAGDDAWSDALDELIGNRALRERIADNGARYLLAARTLEHRAHDWLRALQTLVGY